MGQGPIWDQAQAVRGQGIECNVGMYAGSPGRCGWLHSCCALERVPLLPPPPLPPHGSGKGTAFAKAWRWEELRGDWGGLGWWEAGEWMGECRRDGVWLRMHLFRVPTAPFPEPLWTQQSMGGPQASASQLSQTCTLTTARPSSGYSQQAGIKNRLLRGENSHHLALLSLTTITGLWAHPLPKQLSTHSFIQPGYFLGTTEETKQFSCPQAVMSNWMFLTWSKSQGQEENRWGGWCWERD